MSKIGKKRIFIDKTIFLVKSFFFFNKFFKLKLNNSYIKKNNCFINLMHKKNKTYGTLRNKLKNFLKLFKIKMELFGVGYYLKKNNKFLELKTNFSHILNLKIDFYFKVNKNKVLFRSRNNEKLGNFCSNLIKKIPRDSYKKKGLYYYNEFFFPKQKKKK
ncbi:hypothetical protein [Candidatus Vidania fulgoroideorum]